MTGKRVVREGRHGVLFIGYLGEGSRESRETTPVCVSIYLSSIRDSRGIVKPFGEKIGRERMSDWRGKRRPELRLD